MSIFRLFSLLLVASICSVASAQTSGRISGTVRNQPGNALAHITVTLTGGQPSATQIRQTDAYGRYQFSPVNSGTYQLAFTDQNFIKYIDDDPQPDQGTVYMDAMWPETIILQENQIIDLGNFSLTRNDSSDNRQSTATVTDCTSYGDGSSQSSQTLSHALSNAKDIFIECSGTIAVPELTIIKDVKISSTADVKLEASGFNRIFRVLPGVSLHVTGIDITNGDFTDGIALQNLGTTLLENAEITGHKGNSAVIVNRGKLTLHNIRQYQNSILYNSVIINTGEILGTDISIESHTSTAGPLITNDGRIELQRCTIDGLGTNNVWSVHNEAGSTIKLFDCTFTRSSSPLFNEGTLEVYDSSIDGNSGDQGLIESHGVLILGGTGITNNDVSGAVIANQGSAVLINSTISGNSAGFGVSDEAYAGAISNTGLMQITTSTIANNTHRAAGDRQIGNSGELTLSNSIIKGVESGTECAGNSPAQSLGHNLHTDGTCGNSQQTDIPFGNPGLLPLANNGGLSQSHALEAGSDAIDAGNCGNGATAKDQLGTPRPQGTSCDIGAYELIIRGTETTDQQVNDPDDTQTNTDQTNTVGNQHNNNDTSNPDTDVATSVNESGDTVNGSEELSEASSTTDNAPSNNSGGGTLDLWLLLLTATVYSRAVVKISSTAE